jgi:hypothetical protein
VFSRWARSCAVMSALPGTTAPSDSCMISVGSFSPRLGSISNREKQLNTAGTPSAAASLQVTASTPMS